MSIAIHDPFVISSNIDSSLAVESDCPLKNQKILKEENIDVFVDARRLSDGSDISHKLLSLTARADLQSEPGLARSG